MKNLTIIYTILLFCYNLILHAQGVLYNQEFQVNTYTHCNQFNPCISHLTNGDFIICWESYGIDGSSCGISGQILNSDGSKQGNEIQINTYTDDSQYYPSVSSLKNDGFVVCWESYNQNDNGWGIYAQLFNEDGSKRGTEFQVNTYTNIKSSPSVSNLTNGEFVICWVGSGQDTNSYGIYYQLFNSDGSKKGTEFQVATSIYYYFKKPNVTHLTNGDFIICWWSYSWNPNIFNISFQLFNSDGSKRGSEFQVNTYKKYTNYNPCVSHLTNGDFIICWESMQQDSTYLGIYGQLFNSNGSKKGTYFQMNSYINSDQYNPSISNLSNDRFAVCWESQDQDGSNLGIFAKYYLYPPINHTLIPFSLLEPEYDEIIETVNVSFKWRQPSPIRVNLPFEIEYHLYLDNNENFSNPRIISAIYDTTCTVDSLMPGTTYFWKVLAKNLSGDSLWSSETKGFFVSYDATEVKEKSLNTPEKFQLHANYPNPFNPETTIKYFLPADKSLYQVVIKIYDALGKLVMTLKDEPQKPGVYTVEWSGKNATGHPLPSGIYLCVIQAGQFKATQKMLLIR